MEINKKPSSVNTSFRVFIRESLSGFGGPLTPETIVPMLGAQLAKKCLREENDEWTARAESFANIRLLCGICYESARELNFPTWRQFFPGSV